VTSVGLTTATTRALLSMAVPGRPEPAGLAEAVAHQLGDAIRRGILLDGECLPPEPQLAAQLGISTVTLRDSLASLRQQSLVVTRRGRGGGTFVVAPDLSAGLPARLRELSCAGLRDLGDERAAVSGMAARLAAERALPSEVTALRDQLDRLAAAKAVGDRRRAGTQLSLAIAAAAQSPRLVQAELQFAAEVGDLLWLGADQEQAASLRSHAALIDAIEARDQAGARDLAEQQVRAETTRLIALRLRAYQAEVQPAEDPLEGVAAGLTSLFSGLEHLGARFAEIVREPSKCDDLAALRPEIFAILDTHAVLAKGAGVITAPDVLTEAALWVEWWWTTSASGAPERLRVNLDPAAPDFYDYTTAAWYADVRDSGAPQAVGPYVDHFCTGDYTITLSVPVTASGRFVGVAAADVLVSSLERQVTPVLRDSALTSADGRVIASADPHRPPGTLSFAATLTPAPLAGWRLATPAP
jgi:DNA-binding FadR family transcriptional regulator